MKYDENIITATLGVRLLARLIDVIVVCGVWFTLLLTVILILPTESVLAGITSLIIFIAAVLYEPFMLIRKGATIGKRTMNLRVVMDDGKELSKGVALGRSLALLIPFLPLISIFSILSSKNNQGVHDTWAHTKVVRV